MQGLVRYHAHQKLVDRDNKARSILSGTPSEQLGASLKRSGSTLGRPGEFLLISQKGRRHVSRDETGRFRASQMSDRLVQGSLDTDRQMASSRGLAG